MDWNPRSKYSRLLDQITTLLTGGEERTVRDVYYALEARGYDWDYDKVKRAVKKGRRAGHIDPAQIVDTSRQTISSPNPGYDSPVDFLNRRVHGIWNSYFDNPWDEMDTYVEVWLEKASLVSVFRPICDEWNVRLEATRGDWSDSKVYQAAGRLRQQVLDCNDVRILYFGDFNPSGFHAPVSTINTMRHYGLDYENWEIQDPDIDSEDPRYFDCEHHSPHRVRVYDEDGEIVGKGSIGFERVAINLDHITRFDLPENPTPSGTDKDRKLRERFKEWVSDGQDTNVELNALKEYEREFLEELIEDAITQHVDDEVWSEVENRVAQQQRKLGDAIEIDRSAF
jgi:hypothetical protein